MLVSHIDVKVISYTETVEQHLKKQGKIANTVARSQDAQCFQNFPLFRVHFPSDDGDRFPFKLTVVNVQRTYDRQVAIA